jgi:hypothetical protein
MHKMSAAPSNRLNINSNAVRATSIRSLPRCCIFTASHTLDQAAHFRHRLLGRPEVEDRNSDRKARTSANAISAVPWPDPTGAASNRSRTHSESVSPAARARSFSMANSASLTFMPTDLYGAEASSRTD